MGYAESMKLSERFAAEFRGFWDLPEDFAFDIATPTVPADVTEKPGKITPEESADAYLARVAGGLGGDAAARPASTLDRETLEALLDEKLTRREVKDIQSGYKDPDRFEKWLAVLQERVSYDDPIVLPMGEGLNAVRSPDGDWSSAATAATTSARRTGTGRWRRSSSCATTAETMGEIYPGFAGPDTDWSELREFYCPSCARQLEVEAVPPGYPVLHEFLPDIEGFYRGWLGREIP